MAEAQTLTYDANEQPEGELNAEEKEALEVGEKLAEQQESLLAGKFKDAEELEKGYIELQKKLGSSEEEVKEETPETKDEKVEEKVDTAFLDTLWEEANDKFTDETIQKLQGMKSQDLAQMYLEYRSANQPEAQPEFTEENVSDLKAIAGGDEQYTSMMGWTYIWMD